MISCKNSSIKCIISCNRDIIIEGCALFFFFFFFSLIGLNLRVWISIDAYNVSCMSGKNSNTGARGVKQVNAGSATRRYTQLWSVTTPCRRSTNRRPQGKLCVTCRRWPVACVISLHAFPQIQWYTLLASSFCFLFEGGRKLWDRLYTIEFYLK